MKNLRFKRSFSTGLLPILPFIALIGFLQHSCRPRERADTEAVQEEMRSREVKKISDAELMIKGESMGLAILQETEQTFQQSLMKAVQEQGTEGAISFCNLNAYSLVRGYQDSLGVEIKRVTDRPRNPADTLSAFEKEIFEAYEFAPEMATAQLQELDENTLILTKPIIISNGVCLNCHGKTGSEISEATYRQIQSLYPQDQAVNYKIGDLRGMWSVRIPKKAVINQL